MRSYGTTTRVATVVLTATIGVLAPGLHPLGVAQPASGANDAPLKPPPVNTSLAPAPDNKPDKAYKQEVACVTRDQSAASVVLRDIPWGQQYLQINEVHSHMRAAVQGHAGKTAAGEAVRVAVIDTGVSQHPSFGTPVENGPDYVGSPGNSLEDCDGHGTEVAGIIGAKPQDQIGFVGMAPDAQIVSIRQSSQNYKFDDKAQNSAPPPADPEGGAPEGGAPESGAPESGEPPADGGTPGQSFSGPTLPGQGNGGRQLDEKGGSAGTLGTLAKAVMSAIQRNVKVINMSVDNCRPAGGGNITPDEQKLQAAIRRAVEADIVVVAAAGNTSDICTQNNQADPSKPVNIVSPPWFADDVISVAAIDLDGSVAPFSVNGPWVTVAAPGTRIISLDPSAGAKPTDLANQTVQNGQAVPIQGTSFAAPYVAGLAALVRAKFPDLNARQVMNRITWTAQHPGARSGRDQFVGFGVINPMAALTAIIPGEETIALGRPFEPPQPNVAALPSDMPPPDNGNRTPMIVALTGAGGGLLALLITLFVVHTVRRNRPDPA